MSKAKDRRDKAASTSGAPADKEARLAEALRANLKRRKTAPKKPKSPKSSP